MRSWIHITSGRGPEECRLGVERLCRSILKEAKAADYPIELLDRSPDWASAVLTTEAPDQWLRSLEGTISWRCESPLRPNHRRKNWFMGIVICPEPAPTMDPPNIRFEYYQGSGPGGQHRNRTRTAVRLTCESTGIIVTAEEERSQHANKRLALARYARRRQALEAGDSAAFRTRLWVDHLSLERGQPVRVYVGPKFRLEQTGVA